MNIGRYEKISFRFGKSIVLKNIYHTGAIWNDSKPKKKGQIKSVMKGSQCNLVTSNLAFSARFKFL